MQSGLNAVAGVSIMGDREPAPDRKKKHKKKPAPSGSNWGYFVPLLQKIFSFKNGALVVGLVAGGLLAARGITLLSKVGMFAIPYIAAGFALVGISLYMRIFMFND